MRRVALTVWAAVLGGMGLFVAGCATTGGDSKHPAPIDRELQLAASGGQAAFDAGSIAAAIELYGVALKRARLHDDRGEIARNAYNLAICWAAANRWQEAESAIVEARREGGADRYLSGQIELVAAKIAWRRGDSPGARKALETAKSEFGSKPPPMLSAQVHLLRGILDCESGAPGLAQEEWAEASALVGKSGDLRLLAELDELEARLLLRSGMVEKAAAVFDREAERLRRLGQQSAMVETLQAAGRAYEEAGQDAVAADRFYRAGRSGWSAGDKAAAADLLKRAALVARRAGADELAVQAEMLLREK